MHTQRITTVNISFRIVVVIVRQEDRTVKQMSSEEDNRTRGRDDNRCVCISRADFAPEYSASQTEKGRKELELA